MDALDLLHEDHRAILAMLDRLEAGPADGRAVTPDDLPARRQLVSDLVSAGSAHESVEEKHFWPRVRQWLADDEELLAPALSQEQAAKKILAELERAPAGEPRFEQLVARITADAREHIAYEEEQVWPRVRARVGRGELTKLGRTIAKATGSAPTRPAGTASRWSKVAATVITVALVVAVLRPTRRRRSKAHHGRAGGSTPAVTPAG